MPRGDRTGPNGMGTMTGRGAGLCAGNQTPGYTNVAPGRGNGLRAGRGAGFGFSCGGGRGWRNWFGAAVLPENANPGPVEISPEEEKKMLASQLGELKNQLAAVSQRLSDLEDK